MWHSPNRMLAALPEDLLVAAAEGAPLGSALALGCASRGLLGRAELWRALVARVLGALGGRSATATGVLVVARELGLPQALLVVRLRGPGDAAEPVAPPEELGRIWACFAGSPGLIRWQGARLAGGGRLHRTPGCAALRGRRTVPGELAGRSLCEAAAGACRRCGFLPRGGRFAPATTVSTGARVYQLCVDEARFAAHRRRVAGVLRAAARRLRGHPRAAAAAGVLADDALWPALLVPTELATVAGVRWAPAAPP